MATDVYFARGGVTYGDAVGSWATTCATWPFATLQASRGALVLRVGLFWPFLRIFTFRREDVLSLRVHDWWCVGSVQVEHQCPGCPRVITFGTARPRALFAALAELGYPQTPRQRDARETTPLLLLAAFCALALAPNDFHVNLGTVWAPDTVTDHRSFLGFFIYTSYRS